MPNSESPMTRVRRVRPLVEESRRNSIEDALAWRTQRAEGEASLLIAPALRTDNIHDVGTPQMGAPD